MGEQVALHWCAGGMITGEQVGGSNLSKMVVTVAHILTPRSSLYRSG